VKVFVEHFRARFGNDSLRLILNTGDTVYAPKEQSEDIIAQGLSLFGEPEEEDEVVIAPGNHDYDGAPDLMREGGATVAEGHLEAKNGVSIYGKADPRQTPFRADSYFPDPEYTETELGEEAKATIDKQPVDFLMMHEPQAVEAAVEIPNLIDVLRQPAPADRLKICPPNGEDGYPDIMAAAVLTGHNHVQYPIKLICNSDGTWTTINNQGSAGGANPNSSYNSWNDPAGRPAQDIQWRAFYRNNEYGSITGALEITIATTAYVVPIHRIDIGTPDGAPFPTTPINRFPDETAAGAKSSHSTQTKVQ
jgi:hypothetical protein